MRNRFILLLSILLSTFATKAQLVAGDIAFIGYNTDGGVGTNDNFSFITLTDIPGSEVIYLTEEGWDNMTSDWVGTSEGHLTYTAPPAGLPCGTVVHINETGTSTFTVTGGGTAVLSSGSGWSLSGGDQVIAYQADSPEPGTEPTFIAGVHGDDGNGAPVTLDPVTKWNDSDLLFPLGTARSEQPAGLTNTVNCVSLFPAVGTELDNAKYTGTLTGTSTFLRSLINDYTNWSTDNSTAFAINPGDFSPSVTCVAPCSNPTIPSITYAPTTICDGESTTLTISGTLNDATQWHIYTGSCGGTEIGTTAGTTFDVTPAAPSTIYYIRGEGGCVTPGTCGSVTVTITAEDDPTVTYSDPIFCPNGTDPTPTIATPGGTFTVDPAGLVIDSGTGEADLSASTPDVYTITYVTSGDCPSSSELVFVIEDDEAPVPDLADLPDITAECEVTELPIPGVTDNCTADISISNDAELPLTEQGTTTITWTYDDGNGNITTQEQTIIIDDITGPSPDLAVLEDLEAECEITSLTSPGATDNCGGEVTVTNDVSLPITEQGTTVITWTYTDEKGNTTTQTQTVVIDDVTAPIPDEDPLVDFTSSCDITELPAPSATDNCGGTITATSDAIFPITEETTVTWTYDDGNGNTVTQSQNIVFAPIDVSTTLLDVVTIAANNTSADSYQWINCETNILIDGATEDTYMATENGDYAVIITEGECTDTSDCVTISNVGITVNESNEFKVYPNPTSHQHFTISHPEKIESITVIDLNGRTIQTDFIGTTGQVLLNHVASGNYFLTILTKEGTLMQTMITVQ